LAGTLPFAVSSLTWKFFIAACKEFGLTWTSVD